MKCGWRVIGMWEDTECGEDAVVQTQHNDRPLCFKHAKDWQSSMKRFTHPSVGLGMQALKGDPDE